MVVGLMVHMTVCAGHALSVSRPCLRYDVSLVCNVSPSMGVKPAKTGNQRSHSHHMTARHTTCNMGLCCASPVANAGICSSHI